MLITTNPQLMLWETILPPGYRTCPHDLPRIMDGQRLAPGFEQPRQRTVQPAAPRRLHQQRATGVRHQRLTPRGGRRPTSSVNVITAHDGFTLADLVSYDRKHNEANGEANGTAPTTTGRVTAVSRALPSTARSWPCAPARAGPCSPRCCCRSEFR
jgi:hypothetical protein